MTVNPPEPEHQKPIPVIVTGVDVSIGDLVSLTFKLFFASLPLALLLYVLLQFLALYNR